MPLRQSQPYAVRTAHGTSSEAGGLCALQEKGAASNCDGYAPVLLRSARVFYAWGSEQQPKRKASMRFLHSWHVMMHDEMWATAMVAELRNVAHLTGKDVGVPEAFRSLT